MKLFLLGNIVGRRQTLDGRCAEVAFHSREMEGQSALLPANGVLFLQFTAANTVDHSISWKDRVDSVCWRLGRKYRPLRRTFRQLTPAARRMSFISVILPDLEYAGMAILLYMEVDFYRNRWLGARRRTVR